MLICCELHIHVQQQHGAIALLVCSCNTPTVPRDDLETKSTQNGGRRGRILQVFPLPVEEMEQE